MTESYTCGQDCGDSEEFNDVPYCVLKSFPFAQEHASKCTRDDFHHAVDNRIRINILAFALFIIDFIIIISGFFQLSKR